MAIDPLKPTTIYAGTYDGGIYKSTNGGVSWMAANTGLSANLSVSALAINPAITTTLYAGTYGKGGVYKSTDSGTSWTSTGLQATIQALAIDPLTPTTIYAGTLGDGVYKSTNGGSSWVLVSTGLGNLDVRGLAIDPLTPTTIYAGTFGDGIYKSTNGGGNWSAINIGLGQYYILALAVDPLTPMKLYAGTDGGGLYKSTNGGANWSLTSLNLTTITLAIDPLAATTIYAGCIGKGVYKSTDGGANWASINAGLSIASVSALVINPTDRLILYAGTDGGGVCKTTDSGTIWAVTNVGLAATLIEALAIAPTDNLTLYAGTVEGVYKSLDGALNWKAANIGLDVTGASPLIVDPVDHLTLYSGTNGGVFKSTNGGTIWSATSLPTTNVRALAIDQLDHLTIYAGTNQGVYKTVNGGTNWSPTGLTAPAVTALAIDPMDHLTIYAGTNSGSVYKSTNGGTSWANMGLATAYVRTLVVDPKDHLTIYAGAFGIYKSIDGGTSWTVTGLPPIDVFALALDPAEHRTMYAGTGGRGVYKSIDGGANWLAFNSGLPVSFVTSLAIDSSGKALYAGTARSSSPSGVFSYEYNCSYAISATTQPLPNNGGTGSLTVTAPSGCGWRVSSRDSWLTITSGSSGSGNGTINYSITKNSNPNSRNTTLDFTEVNYPAANLTTSISQASAQANTTAMVRSSANPSTFGQSLTFTATVSIAGAGTGTPTGTITFLDRGLSLGTAPLVNGSATFSTSSLSAGTHSISVAYSGDSNFLSSASAPLPQTVRPNFAPCGGATFSSPATYVVGANPYWLAATSLRNNGKLDLVAANRNSNNLSLLTGSGNGTFQSTGTPAAGTNPSSVAVGDFNGDGKADLAVANENSNNVSLLLGNGDGTFQAAVNYPIGAGARAVVVGDFNRDGKLDLAVANFGSSNLSVLLGNGDGTFQTATNYPTGQNAISIAQGDFNGDGNVDLAVANYSANNLSLFLGKGDGTFQTPVNFPVGTNPHSIAAGDFNGDGKLDLAVANYGANNVSVLLGNGNSTFQTAINYGVGQNPVYVAVGDFNGDGNADLAVANHVSDNVSILLGTGQGTFQTARNFNTGRQPRFLVIEDFNGDGELDLAVGNETSGTVSILLNTCGQADLSILATASSPVLVGGQLTYTITVTNQGPSAASAVVVADSLPASTTFVSCSAPGGICGGTGNNRTISFASLAAGTSATATLTTTVTGSLIDGDVINNIISVSSTTVDPDASNNTLTLALTVKGIPQAKLMLNGAFDFGPLTPVRTPPAAPPSDTFTVENTGNAALNLSFASLLRTGSDVDGQKITNADDRNLYSLRALSANGSETPLGIGSTSTIAIGQRQTFRVLYNPVMPLVADRTRGLSASQVLQDINTSVLTISQNRSDPLKVTLMGRITPTVQMISPVAFRRDGNDIVVEASAYDPNLNTYLMRYQFLDSSGRNVGLAADIEIRAALQASTIVKGQSFVVEQRFPGAAANASISNVRVTAYDGEGDSTATSGVTAQTVNALATVSAASYSEFGIASEAMVSAFGSGLATTAVGAVSRPLPTSLGGTTVKVKDSMGTERLASLFYVSPTQVNYLIPTDTKPGLATITITSGDGKVAMGTTNIAWVAPSLFSANSDGQGVAAAAIQRVTGEDTQSFEAVATFDTAQNKFVTRPINLGAASDQVYLTLFGTGIRHCSSLATAKAMIGGVEVPVAYAGAQGDFVGLDQVNVLLPRSLAGRGEIEVKLVVDYQTTNTVKINIK